MSVKDLKVLKAHKFTGLVNGYKVLLGFMDPNHPTLAQILTPGTGDFSIDSELLRKRVYLGEIDPVS